MAARVVVLPDPVGPVTRISPRCSSASVRTTSGSPISSNDGPPKRSFRSTIDTEPRCRKTFARKRPTLATEYAKSTSPRSLNRAFRSSGITPSAIACVSIGLSGTRSSRTKPWVKRTSGGDPTFTCRSDPLALTSSSSQELNSGTIVWSIGGCAPSRLSSRGTSPRGRSHGFPSAGSPGDFSPGQRGLPRKGNRRAHVDWSHGQRGRGPSGAPTCARPRDRQADRGHRHAPEDIGIVAHFAAYVRPVRVDVLLTIEGWALRDRITKDVTALLQPLLRPVGV